MTLRNRTDVFKIFSRLFYSSVATVIINPQQLNIVEGNNTMNSTHQFCVFLKGIMGNVQREVIVNIAATEVTATGIILMAVLAIADTLYFVRCL